MANDCTVEKLYVKHTNVYDKSLSGMTKTNSKRRLVSQAVKAVFKTTFQTFELTCKTT